MAHMMAVCYVRLSNLSSNHAVAVDISWAGKGPLEGSKMLQVQRQSDLTSRVSYMSETCPDRTLGKELYRRWQRSPTKSRSEFDELCVAFASPWASPGGKYVLTASITTRETNYRFQLQKLTGHVEEKLHVDRLRDSREELNVFLMAVQSVLTWDENGVPWFGGHAL